jgi:predicted O-methyltransferase YrrM
MAMISRIQSFVGYVRHAAAAQSKFRLHSPFAYRFYNEVIKNGIFYPQYSHIERVRKDMIGHSRFIKRRDMGARAKEIPCDQRFVRVKDVARRSSISPMKGRFLFRLTRDLNPKNILELGTAFGISALYMANAAPRSRIITIEGCLDSAHLAEENFEMAGTKNIKVLAGTFEKKLPLVWEEMPVPDMVFFDGNHKKGPTLRYFEECLQHIHPGTVFIFDDIHWSSGMESAWKEIRNHPSVKVTIDLYYMGIVFFREELSKEDYILNL